MSQRGAGGVYVCLVGWAARLIRVLGGMGRPSYTYAWWDMPPVFLALVRAHGPVYGAHIVVSMHVHVPVAHAPC